MHQNSEKGRELRVLSTVSVSGPLLEALSALCQVSLSTTLKGKEESPDLTVEIEKLRK